MTALVYNGARALLRTPTHLYLAPHPLLRPYIAHYTLCLRAPRPPRPRPGGCLTLIPDASGCLVFELGAAGLEGRVYGPTSRAVTVQNDLGVCPLRFFVEFLPGGLLRFLREGQQALADRVLPLGQVERALERTAAELFEASADLDGFVEGMDAALLRWETAAGPSAAVLRAAGAVRAARGALPVRELARSSGYSERHLARLFREQLGVGPKTFARLVRVNEAVRLLQRRGMGCAALSQELGYYDQAHFIHEFASVCGASPTAYLGRMSGFYNERFKF